MYLRISMKLAPGDGDVAIDIESLSWITVLDDYPLPVVKGE
jgi:hypothetical protein